MKKTIIILFILSSISIHTEAQSISIPGSSYHLYGPNSSWSEYLKIGGNGRGTTSASVVTTNGNLHLDSKDGRATYINQFSEGNTYISPIAGNVGIGTFNTSGFKLAVNGHLRAKEITVDTGWADFVFQNNYPLPSLKDVETHIKEKGHLQDIPSAEEVEKNGIALGEMNAKLLQKIEELMLYTIQQQKEIDALKKEIKDFDKSK